MTPLPASRTVSAQQAPSVSPALSSRDYSFYMADLSLHGPGGIQQMLSAYGEAGWILVQVVNLPGSEWLLFFWQKERGLE